VASQAMESFVVFVLNIWETLIPSAWMRGVIHAQYMHNHPLDDLYLAIILGVEGSGFVDLSVQQ